MKMISAKRRDYTTFLYETGFSSEKEIVPFSIYFYGVVCDDLTNFPYRLFNKNMVKHTNNIASHHEMSFLSLSL